MSRFVIRNYGPSRQIAYKGQQICLSNDQCIETDDADMAQVLGEAEQIHVTDRGIESAAPIPPEKPEPKKEEKPKEREVTVDDVEAVHDEKFPDDTESQETEEGQLPVSSSEGVDEIAYADMTIKELIVLAKDRQIKTSGVKKAGLIEALEAYDAVE